MRLFIALVVAFFLLSFSLQAHTDKKAYAVKKAEKMPQFLTKKQNNSLKTELFSDQVDLLQHPVSHYSLAAITQPFKRLRSPLIVANLDHYEYAANSSYNYSFSLQGLYPKHSFW